MSDRDSGFVEEVTSAAGFVPIAGARPVERSGAAGPNLAWARFWAKSVDVMLYTFLMIGPASLIPGIAGVAPTFFGLVSFPLALLIDAVVLSVFGTSIGKMLAGVRVVGETGRPPGLARSFERNLRIYLISAFGLAPLAAPFYLLQYLTLRRTGSTWWDRNAGTRVESVGSGPVRTFILGCGYLVLVAGLYVLIVVLKVSREPPSEDASMRAAVATPERPAQGLQAAIDALRSKLPMRIDDTTSLQGLQVGDGVLTYYYDVKAEPSQWSAGKDERRSSLFAAYCASSSLAAAGVTARYDYYAGETHLGSFTFQPSECGAKSAT